MNGCDIWMIQGGQISGFRAKIGQDPHDPVRTLPEGSLYRHIPSEFLIARQVDLAHAAGPDRLDNPVMVKQSTGPETLSLP
jgi:hypothetical protein